MKTLSVFTALVLTFLLFSCEFGTFPPVKEKFYQQTSFKSLQGWKYGNVILGYKSFLATCANLEAGKFPANTLFRENQNLWLYKCHEARKYKTNPQAFFEKHFYPYLVEGADGYHGTFTAYYEIEMEGSRIPSQKFRYPVYGVPNDRSLLNLTRAQIQSGALKGKAPVIAYVASPGRLYFLHIQGSGRIVEPNGNIIHLGFAAANNYAYKSFAADIIASNILKSDERSATKMMEWIDKNYPKSLNEVIKNPRYIFFETRNNSPRGSLGVDLTPMGSIAVDTTSIPLGLPVWVETTYPNVAFPGLPKNLTFLVNAQDTGAAIKGAVRADIFFGSGKFAETVSSGMKQQGKYYMLLPKEIRAERYF